MNRPDGRAGPEPRWETLRRRSQLAITIARNPRTALRPCRYLFVFSHMRSRSTLLTHVLGSHPEISGHLETHIRYRRRRDFVKLRYRVCHAHGGEPIAPWVMDKILHQWYAPPALLDRMEVVPIFLLREPEDAIPSIRNYVQGRGIGRASRHYLGQLAFMRHCAARLRNPGIFVRSESILEETGPLFRLLERELGLSSSLSESYSIFESTGQSNQGDLSPMIRSGHILRSGERSFRRSPVIPPELLAEARQSHRECVELLERRCAHLPRQTAPAARPQALAGP